MMAARAIGVVIGDLIGYEVGNLGPPLHRSRLGRRVGEARWARAGQYLAISGGRVFFGRFVGVLRALVPAIAGLSRMPYRTFLLWNAAGAAVWAPGFIVLVYGAGSSYDRVATWVGRASALPVLPALLGLSRVAGAWAAVRREQAMRAWGRRQVDHPAMASCPRSSAATGETVAVAGPEHAGDGAGGVACGSTRATCPLVQRFSTSPLRRRAGHQAPRRAGAPHGHGVGVAGVEARPAAWSLGRRYASFTAGGVPVYLHVRGTRRRPGVAETAGFARAGLVHPRPAGGRLKRGSGYDGT